MKLLTIIAGTNDPSNAATLADAFMEGVGKVEGTTIETVKLKDQRIGHFTLADYDPSTAQKDDFSTLEPKIKEADGILVATPVWNFGVPAHLKNFTDRMGSFALDAKTRSKGQLKGKPFYFIFTGGAPVPVWKGLMRFTTSSASEGMRYFGGSIIGRYYEGKCMVSREQFGLVVDKRPESLTKMRKKGEKFARLAMRIKKTGKLPLYYRLLGWGYRKGQRVVSKFF